MTTREPHPTSARTRPDGERVRPQETAGQPLRAEQSRGSIEHMFDATPRSAALADDRFDPAAASDDALVERVASIERRRTQLDAEEAAVLAELEARGTCDREFGLTTAGWLAREAGLPAPVARARVAVGKKLRSCFPVVAEALSSGRIGWEHARVLVGLANARIVDVVAANQTMLVGLADRCRFERWRAEVQALARLWDQDGGYDPAEDPAANRLSHGTTVDGLTSLTATFTGDDGAVVTQAIETRADELFRRAVADHDRCADLAVPPRATLRALALTDLIRRSLGVDLDRTKAPRTDVMLVIGADDPTTATDPDGVRLADGTTRVLRCDAAIRALVVDNLGVPLDLGRRFRWATDAQRQAARRRDGGCVFPGCDAPVTWCDVHHCIHDEHGGATDLCNLVCLCRHHHGVVHRTGWSVLVDGDGWAVLASPSGSLSWGQRHGRQREGPPPDPRGLPRTADRCRATGPEPPSSFVVPGRYQRTEDPHVTAHARQLVLDRVADLRPRAA